MSGASGAVYGHRLVEVLAAEGHELHLVVSRHAVGILRDETGVDWTAPDSHGMAAKVTSSLPQGAYVLVHDNRNLGAPVASGSFGVDATFVVPCSMKTLAGIASGYAETLIQRAADVALKEGRPLILCPRETPLSAIHLENMLKLARLGVRIVPPMPAFYNRPEGMADQVDFIVGKLLDSAGIGHTLYRRWTGGEG